MWNRLAELIIRYRVLLILVIAFLTAIMGFFAARVQMSYDFARTVPLKDPDMIMLQNFRQQFGEDGNIIAIGMQDSAIYTIKNFEAFRDFSRAAKQISGVNDVVSLPVLKMILKDTENARFYFANIFPEKLDDQQKFDSLLRLARNQRVYMGQLVNETNGATAMLVSLQKDVMNSSRREEVTEALVRAGADFEKKTNIKLHYAGLPFIRTVIANSVRKEMQVFLYASALITGLIMF